MHFYRTFATLPAFELPIRLRMVPSGDDMPNGIVFEEPSEGMTRGIRLLVRDELGAMTRQDLGRNPVSREPGLEDHDGRFSRRRGEESPTRDEPEGIVEECDQPLRPAVNGHLFPTTLPEAQGMGPLRADPCRSWRSSFLSRNEPSFTQNTIDHRLWDHTTGPGGDMPGEGKGSELADPARDQNQEDRVPRRWPWLPPGRLENKRASVGPGVANDLIDPFAADAISCDDGRDSLAAINGGDDLPGVVGRQFMHAPNITGCQVTMRSYTCSRLDVLLLELPESGRSDLERTRA